MSSEIQHPIDTADHDESVWIRGLFMLLFVLLYGVAEIVVLAVTLVQFGWVVANGEPNARLGRFGASLSRYIFATLQYWMFNSDEKPFPFAEWPRASEGA